MPNNPDVKLPWWLPLALLTAVLVSSCIATYAQAGEVDLSGIDVGELGITQSQTILFNAQAEMAKAKAQRSINSGTASADQAVSYSSPIQASPSTSAPTEPQQQEVPVIKAITGTSNKLRAMLLYSSGIEVEATAGSRDLPGNFRVAQITLEGVVLERSGKRFLLGFSDRAPGGVSLSPTAPTSMQPAMPGLAPRQY